MRRLLVLAGVVGLVGCGTSGPVVQKEEETKAEYHLAFADSLETAGSFQGAALVYKMVAELYPNTMYYANAVRNLGHLYVNPFNIARNDSTAMYWFVKHLELPWLPRGERTRSVIMLSMIKERMQYSSVDHRRLTSIDSLTSLVKIQASELRAQSKKIADLTAELEQTDNDLQILLEYQKNPAVARRDTSLMNTPVGQRLAEADETQQSKKKVEQTNEQLQKLREIDLRALQRRARR